MSAIAPTTGTSAPWYVGANGATNYTRHEAQRFARSLLNSQAYRDWLEERIKTKTLSSPIETLLWHYGYGKPPESILLQVSQGQEDLSSLSMDELIARADAIRSQLEEARALASAVPGEVLKGPW